MTTDKYEVSPDTLKLNPHLADVLKADTAERLETWAIANKNERERLVDYQRKAWENVPKPPSGTQKGNPHKAKKAYSELIGRGFDSKAELRYCEMLWMRQLAGEIRCLEFQHEYILSEKPKVTITVDARYLEKRGNKWIPRDDDVKGWRRTPKTKKLVPRIERDFKVKLAWLREKYGISVEIVK